MSFRTKPRPPRERVMPSPIPPEHRRTDVRYATAADVVGVVEVPKDEPLRSEVYRQWIAGLSCFACGLQGRSQCAHSNSPAHGKGKGIKADDRYTFPLCASQPGRMGCHDRHDMCIDMTRDERRNLEERYIRRAHVMAGAAGWNLETLKRK